MCSSLCKLIRESQGAVDLEVLAGTLAAKQSKQFTSWEEKLQAYQEVSSTVFEHLRSLMHTKANDQSLSRIRELEAEIANLKSRGPVASQEQHNTEAEPSRPEVTPRKQTPHIMAALSKSPIKPLSSSPWTRGSKQRVLQQTCPSGHHKSNVTSWINKMKLAPAVQKSFEDMVKSLQDQKPDDMTAPLADIAAEWGMPVSLACKMSDSELTRCIAIAAVVAK